MVSLHQAPFPLKVLGDIVILRGQDLLDRHINTKVCSYEFGVLMSLAQQEIVDHPPL